jgi:hypothetical protein
VGWGAGCRVVDDGDDLTSVQCELIFIFIKMKRIKRGPNELEFVLKKLCFQVIFTSPLRPKGQVTWLLYIVQYYTKNIK